ncbi:hypothetical protein Tco_1569084 [Tanacetum coccineum]
MKGAVRSSYRLPTMKCALIESRANADHLNIHYHPKTLHTLQGLSVVPENCKSLGEWEMLLQSGLRETVARFAQEKKLGSKALSQDPYPNAVLSMSVYDSDGITEIDGCKLMLGDLKGKSCDAQCVSNTLDPLFQKLKDEKVSLESQPARVHSKSKSSCLSNNFEKLEENHRNSLIPKTQKHKSSECNNIKLAVRNAKSEVVCAMCKQCFVTGNHDVCMLNHVNDMNSRADNQSANVSKLENQKKHKANVRKLKELGSKGSLASSRPSKPRNCLRWVSKPTPGRIFSSVEN